jgi:hypothetical protein
MLIDQAMPILAQQSNVVRLSTPTKEAPLTIVGDLHGSLEDLTEIIRQFGTPSFESR